MRKDLFLFLTMLFAGLYVQATDYYTASPGATLAGNAAASANWTTNADGTTGLTSVTIVAGDNLFILNGGVASIINTGTMTVASLNIHAGGTIIHNTNAAASTFTITGLLTWNGTIKTLQAASGSNFFNANGNVTGTTAVHDISSTRGVYLGGTGKTISLTQLSTGVITGNLNVGLLIGSSRALAGNCRFYTPLIFNGTTVTLDLAGYNLQVSSIKSGNTSTRLVKGHANSKLTISGTNSPLGNTSATLFTFDPAAAVLNELNVNSEYLASAAGPVTINGNLTVNALNFGTASGDKATRLLQVNGNFTLANNGTMRVQAGGPTAITAYDQLSATGNISIGTATTLKVDIINAYTTSTQPFLTVAQTTSPGTVSGTFGTTQNTAGYTGNTSYTANAVKYQILTTPPPVAPPPPCPISLTPDLPLLPSNATIEAEINTAVQRFSDAYLGTAEPTAAALSGAVASYNALGIAVDGYTITATTAVTSYLQTTFLKTFAQYLKFHPEDSTDVFIKALNTVWLVSERMCKGLLAVDYNQYDYRDFGRSAILIPRIKNNPHVKGLFENLLYQQNAFTYFWESNYQGGINDDHVGNSGNITMAYVKWIESADERYRYMTAFKRFMENFTSYTVGTYQGLKPDGSGFHHWTSYPSYMYNLNGAADIISYLHNTSFQVSSAGYLRLRDAIMAQLMFTNDNTTRFLTMAGRKPNEIATTISRFSFRSMAIAGGTILGTGTSDPVMASYYNRVWGVYSPFGNGTVASFNAGYFQFNHSMAGIYRKDGWLAVCKGFNDNMFGSEIFVDANRFGRYQSYGAVNIIYPGDALTGNGYDVTTWDWNFTPGATVIRLPWDKLHAEKERIDEVQQKKFVGSLSFINKDGVYLKEVQGTYGVFAMDFQEATGKGFGATYSTENHNASFVFKKSVFAFDNMLICLGSNIGNNDAVNNTLTTLYQRKAIAGKEQVTVDGDALATSAYDNSYAGTGNHWIVDNYGTGFYVFAGSGSIKLKKGDQQTPQHSQLLSAQTIANNPVGNYAIGYIDHGTSPSNKAYEYICMPKATAADMVNLNSQVSAGNKPYAVQRKDDSAHIVEYKPANANPIFGYAFFTALSGINNGGLLTSADYPCLVMSSYDSTQKTYRIAVNNPDLGFKLREYTPSVSRQINITIKGTNWQISQPNAGASITGTANGETTIQFTVVDGLPVEIVLSRVLTPQTISFDAIPTKTTTDSAFALTATASSGLAVTYTSSNTAVATVSGNIVTIVGKGTCTITASQPGNDVYEAASPVQQTLTVADVEPPVLSAPANVQVTTDAGAATASNVALGTATATDNDGVPSITNNAPAVYPVGVTTVTWTATDSSGNIATAIQNVTVTDAEAPVITAPASIALNTDEGAATASAVQLGEPAVSDNAAVQSVTNNAPSVYPVGVTTVTWTVTDNAGNSSTAMQTVTVTDAEAPVITAPAAITLHTDAGAATASAVQLNQPVVTDNIAVQSVTNNAPSVYPVGVTTVTWTATDNAGNTATATQTVTVTDAETPVLQVPANQSFCFSGSNYPVPAATVSDNTAVASISYTVSGATTRTGTGADASGSFNTGSSVIIWTVTDAYGNSKSGQTTVYVNTAISAHVADVYALNPAVDAKNTLYLGYGPAALSLSASVSGGSAAYQYSWSNGNQSQSASVSNAGTYSVVVTDSKNCHASASITITVLDVRCGNNNDKVMICHNDKTICVAQGAVQDHMDHGDFVGSCTQRNNASQTVAVRPVPASNQLIVYPNPVADQAYIVLNSMKPNATGELFNVTGQRLMVFRIASNKQQLSLRGLAAGTYMLIVRDGQEVLKTTVVKQ